MTNYDASQNPGNLRKGLLQSSMMKSHVYSNLSPLWKAEQVRDAAQREKEIAEMVGNAPPKTVDRTGLAVNNNFKFWLRGGAAEGEAL